MYYVHKKEKYIAETICDLGEDEVMLLIGNSVQKTVKLKELAQEWYAVDEDRPKRERRFNQ